MGLRSILASPLKTYIEESYIFHLQIKRIEEKDKIFAPVVADVYFLEVSIDNSCTFESRRHFLNLRSQMVTFWKHEKNLVSFNQNVVSVFYLFCM